MRDWRPFGALGTLAVLVALTAGAGVAAAKPWIGVYLSPVTDDVRAGLALPATGGVIVARVLPGEAAERAGLEAEDVILRFDDHEVDSPQALIAAIGAKHEGDEVPIEIVRHGVRRTVGMRLGTLPATGQFSEQPGLSCSVSWHDGHWFSRYRFLDPDGRERERVWTVDAMSDADLYRLLEILDEGGFRGRRLRRGIVMRDPARIRLGIRTLSVDADLATALKVPAAHSVLVTEVASGSTAKNAGLRPGDVITGVNGRALRPNRARRRAEDPTNLGPRLNALGTNATLTVWRNGRRRELAVALTPQPHSAFDEAMDAVPRARSHPDETISGSARVEPPSDTEWVRHLEDHLFAGLAGDSTRSALQPSGAAPPTASPRHGPGDDLHGQE